MNNTNVDIFIYSHKPFIPKVKNKIFKVLTNTSAPIKTNLSVYRDYEGDNISDLNLLYNEYTGLYWLWKNHELNDYIGLNHYRRYFSFLDYPIDFTGVFKKYRCCLSKPLPLKMSKYMARGIEKFDNRIWYGYWHNVEDFDNLEILFKEEYPEYMDGFNKMKNADYIYNSSMFILSKDDFIKYCEFIFPLLQRYRERFGLMTREDCIKHVEDNKDKYIKPHLKYYTVEMQARIVGYIAERAMNAYFMNGNNSLEKQAKILTWRQY